MGGLWYFLILLSHKKQAAWQQASRLCTSSFQCFDKQQVSSSGAGQNGASIARNPRKRSPISSAAVKRREAPFVSAFDTDLKLSHCNSYGTPAGAWAAVLKSVKCPHRCTWRLSCRRNARRLSSCKVRWLEAHGMGPGRRGTDAFFLRRGGLHSLARCDLRRIGTWNASTSAGVHRQSI
jgi:hypothetical protein